MNFLNRLFGKKSVVTLQMTLVDNGVLICLYKNGERIDITDLLCDNLAKKLPEPFVTYFSSQQHKVNIISFSTARTLLQQLHPFVSNEFKLDCKSIDDLTQVSMPPSFRIHFRLNRELQIIERIAIGADLHLGDGWFQKETTVWLIGELTSHKLLSWIYLPQISGQDLYYFVSTVIPEAQILGLPVTCELSIENNFRLNLQIQNMSRRSLSVAVVSNHPNIQKDLSYIANENLHMMSGVVILPNLRQIVTPQILEIARSPIGKRIDGLDIPRFIQDDLRPNAKSLKVEMQAIDEAYRIADGEQLQKQWQLTQEHVKGIGRYIAIPSLMWQENSISEQTFLKLLHTDQRFIQIEGGWIEFRPQTKERLRVESEQYFHRFELNVRELLGIDTDRLKPIKLELPLISVPYNPDDQDAAVEYFNTMRDHGLPAAITGLQEEIPIVFMRVCNSLLLAYPQAQILWIVKSRKLEVVKQEIRKKTHSANSLRQERVTIVAAESLPENIAKKKWTLVVFQELDLLLTSNAHIRTYQNLNRLWSIASLTKQDWNKDRKRLDSTLAVFQLTPSDATLFQAKCVQNFIQQQSSFFSKLTAFFKPVTTQDFEKTRDETTKDVPIPPRAVSKQPVAPTISEVATANISRTGQSSTSFQSPNKVISSTEISTGSFVKQALRYVDYQEALAEPVPLMMYWPTYDQMTAAQKKWYFYWRSELRLKRFLPTDLSYLFVHIYEIISLVGFSSAQVAFEHLVNFWQHYRQLQPKLDNYLVDWIADFIVVHNLDLTPLQWYANALALGYYMGDQELLLEAWSKMGKEYSDIPSNLLYRLGNYSVSNNKFYQSHRNELFLDVQLKLGVESIDRYLQSKENRSLFCPTDPATTRQIRRAPFASALHDYKRQEIVITDVHAWLGDEKFSGIIKSILKQSENLLRERAGYRSKLRGIELPADWIEILEKTFSIKHGSSVFAEQNSQPAFTIDMASVELLRRESETVRARLKVLEDVENEETSSSVIIDTTTTTKVLIDTTIPLETGETTYIQRPENTPPGLLTDLVPIAEIMGPHDAPTAKILSALRHNEWQATLAVLGQAVPDSFVNVILDEINESSYNQIGDALVFNESGIWVVADDFRDEISYILDHPSYAKEAANEIKAESTELSSTDTFLELSSEFSDFASRMQSYHWQALDVLMCDIDVSLKLDSIARTVHSTANRLIDDINEYALESVGDIVIDVSVGVPRIEQEDIEGLNLLLTWANRHDLIKG